MGTMRSCAESQQRDSLHFSLDLTQTVLSINESPHKQIIRSLSPDERDESASVSSSRGPTTDSPQEEMVHLYLSELLINSVEEMQWKEITEGLDFSHPVSLECLIGDDKFHPAHSGSKLRETSSSSSSVSHHMNPRVKGKSLFYTRSPSPPVIQPQTTPLVLDPPIGSMLAVERGSELSNCIDYGKPPSPKSTNTLTVLLREKCNRSTTPRLAGAVEPCRAHEIAAFANYPYALIGISKGINSTTATQSGPAIAIEGERLRQTWRPPKREFIYDLPIDESYKSQPTLLKQQQQRCAGCGIKMNDHAAKRSHLCYYYCKMFCQCCHQDERARIPALILHHWDFRLYPVSDMAYKFLRDSEDSAVYNVEAINPALAQKVRSLKRVVQLRIKLAHMWQYIQLCRQAEEDTTANGVKTFSVRTIFTSLPMRFLSHELVGTFSVLDFVAIANKNLMEMLEPAAEAGEAHITQCLTCNSKAFTCQVCSNLDLLFPFQLERVHRCDNCGSLTHLKCHYSAAKLALTDDDRLEAKCAKCERIRRHMLLQSAELSSD